jgi:drug/metabolite transporter (DMT)-like permease
VLGPLLLLYGLLRTPASSASLLLNLEAVFTSAVAWLLFREHVPFRIVLGMLAIVAGGGLLSWEGHAAWGSTWGPLAIAGACLCWAIDNNLTQKVSAADPVQIAQLKGLVAGVVNTGLAVSLGARLPPAVPLVASLVVGFLGYGISLVCFVLALRALGSARTGAYFSLAPFIGAALGLILYREFPTSWFLAAAALMALGLWLHLSERHQHRHEHEPLEHTHPHVHDEHHRHQHAPGDPTGEPHTHSHRHARLIHAHAHYPDIHHRHHHD